MSRKKRKLSKPKLSDIVRVGSSRASSKDKKVATNVFQIVKSGSTRGMNFLNDSVPVRFKLITPWSFEFVDVYLNHDGLVFRTGFPMCIQPMSSDSFVVSVRASKKKIGR